MKARLLLAFAALAFGAAFRETPPPRAFVLADEPIVFDGLRPRFSDRQLHGSTAATRIGLARWAATESGRALIAHFNTREYRVTVVESREEESSGRAPQPSIATLLSATDHAKVKQYELILNPEYGGHHAFDPVAGEPSTPADMMATAWAGEMLHIYFYSEGISLPHHERADFQERWHTVAAELGFPSLRHDGGEEPDRPRGQRVVYW